MPLRDLDYQARALARFDDYLNGKRSISKDIAKRLARRFNVRADLFL
jgi:antitoxin component HigA of HigAB toxin-antitoxin module